MEVKSKTINVESYTTPISKLEGLYKTKGFAKRFPTVKLRVASILKNDSYARRKDWYLTVLYWIKCGYIKLIIPQDKLMTITSPETITRARRKLIEDAKKGDKKLQFLIKDNETISIRESRRKEMKEYFKR